MEFVHYCQNNWRYWYYGEAIAIFSLHIRKEKTGFCIILTVVNFEFCVGVNWI